VVRVARTTRCCALSVLGTSALVVASGACPEARQGAAITAEQRRQAIVRAWRDAEPAPAPLLAAEPAWSLTLPLVPSAPGAMDQDRIYIPLRQDLLIALNRETGLVEWRRMIDTVAPVVVGRGSLFLVGGGLIRALDAATGENL
jgi:outer membrane protein assembly factor BamB